MADFQLDEKINFSYFSSLKNLSPCIATFNLLADYKTKKTKIKHYLMKRKTSKLNEVFMNAFTSLESIYSTSSLQFVVSFAKRKWIQYLPYVDMEAFVCSSSYLLYSRFVN